MLEWTGERFVPGVRGDIEVEHLHRYYSVSELVAGLHVLDIACGEGYGSAILAKQAESVIGVDISEAAIAHARSAYALANLRFEVGSCTSIPLGDASVDAIVSFETIEHVQEHDETMREFARVLKPGGWLCMSCPDKLEYSDLPNYHNPYHVRELYGHEFQDLLQRFFARVTLYGQRIQYGSLIGPYRGATSSFQSYRDEGSDVIRSGGVLRPVYLLGIASDIACPELPCGAFEPHEAPYVTENQALREQLGTALSNLHARELQLRDELAKAYGQIEAQRLDIQAYAIQADKMLEQEKQLREELARAYEQLEHQRRDLEAYAKQAAKLAVRSKR